MKKIIAVTATLAVLAGLATSCDSWLEEKNYGNPTTEDMMTNPDNVALLVGQIYADVKWVHDHWGYWGVNTLTSDESLCPIRMPDEDWNDSGYWRTLNTHNWTVLGESFNNIWSVTISGAVQCNKVLETIERFKSSMPEKVYLQYVAELEVMRSYYYYLLFDCFGRIPYVEKFSQEGTDPLMEPSKVWSKLVDCLEVNAPNMPKVEESTRARYYGRVTQGLAYSLLARLYLNAPSFDCTPSNIELTNTFSTPIASETDFYTNAARCCEEVISSGSYSIEANFFDNFKIDNSASKENIFVIVENGQADVDERNTGYSGYMLNKLRINLLTLNYSHQVTYGMLEKPWNGFCGRPSFIDRYASRDVRGPGNEGKGTLNEKQWGWFLGPVYNADGTKLQKEKHPSEKDEKGNAVMVDCIIVKEVTSLDEATNLDGARCIKYEIDKKGAYKYCENDFVLFRYADVLWMNEEAILRGGTGTSHYNDADFKRLRTRAFAYEADPAAAYEAAYPNARSLDVILDERGREFALENVRRRDLIRFGKYNDPTYIDFLSETAAADQYRKWFPIPFKVLEKALRDESGKTIWTQNPGYPEF